MAMWLVAAGSVTVVLLAARWLRRRQRDVDELDQGEYQPPLIHGQGGPH